MARRSRRQRRRRPFPSRQMALHDVSSSQASQKIACRRRRDRFFGIDDNEQANLKLICDEIFGAQNFVAQFAWKRKKEISNDSRNVSKQGEYILCYSKTVQTELNRESLSAESIRKSYRPPTKDFPLDYWRTVPITVSKGLSGGGYEYAVETPSGTIHKKIWAYPQHRYEELARMGKIYFGKNGKAIPMRVMYLSENNGKPTSNYWNDVTTNREGKKEILDMFGDNVFQTPKPTRLIEKILRLATDKNSIVLDSFAGSGTTAHAVLKLNATDGGTRKFILVEIEDYADTITAERIRRVIRGYGQTTGTGGSFDFYEVGEPLMIHGNLNENIDVEKVRAYIWYTETHTPYTKLSGTNSAYLGDFNDTAYYFHYERDRRTILDAAFLRTIEQHADSYLIYADECELDEDFLQRNSITFKKIPRDIKKMGSDEP